MLSDCERVLVPCFVLEKSAVSLLPGSVRKASFCIPLGSLAHRLREETTEYEKPLLNISDDDIPNLIS